ncbi:CHC2 zinc finger domain-containing protein [Akkermansiaceae bacterium]|nr:CHC2 zinc finger domain-containing protein [Akkermansiaceae bacterium]
MPRIAESTIDRIKSETDLVALIQSRGTPLKKQGTNWTGLCPFHDDQETPNLIVTPGKGLFRCMASQCGKTGNAIQFVQWFDGVSFRHACDLLSNGGKAAFEQTNGKTKIATVPKLPCPLETAADESKLLGQVADYYHSKLDESALDYLAFRGLDDEALVRRFKIGFSDRTLGLRIPHNNRKEGQELRDKLKALGVYRQNGREHLNGCLTIPITNTKGEVVQIYGRRIAGATPKANRHLYLARKLGGVFNPEALKSREIILCESVLDALTFYRHGMEAVTCSFGTENLTDELFEAIIAAKIESVRIAYDNDEAGERAFVRDAERFIAHGLTVHRIKFPWKSDANSYAQDQGGEALRQSVKNAIWYGQGGQGKTSAPHKSEKSSELSTKVASSLAAKAARSGSETVAKKKKVEVSQVVLERKGDHHEMAFGERLYRVGGLEKNSSLEVLRITLRIASEGLMHVDSLDLYRDGERRKFIDRASEETLLEKDLLKRDLGKLLLALEQAQEKRLSAPADASEIVELTRDEEAEAMKLLKSPKLLDRLTEAYDEAGIAGETNNLLAAYLACASRKLAKPLAVIIQSTSAAGKSTLMEAVLSFFPDEDQVKYSAMTGQSLYYLGETNLKHKILAIVEEEGAEKASYALKLLQSEGELTIASTGKDPQSGRMETQEYHVEGPVAIVFTTTSIDIDEELMNRCLVLTVDESKEQTERIHELQREARTIEGILANEKRKDVLRVMQNAQRLIRPMKIANPFARHLTFTSGRTRTRRDHEKYLTLIDTIALLHQHQRETIKHQVNGREVEMLPVTLEDIEAANKIAPEVLGRSLDELPPQTRRLLESIKSLVREKMVAEKLEQKYSLFSRRELRDFTGWSETQTRLHLERLEGMEYIHRRTGKQGSLCKYELLIAASEKAPTWQVGLLDVAELRKKQNEK